MISIWEALEEAATPPMLKRLAGGPASHDYFKTFKVNFGQSVLQCDLPYGYVGCDGPSDQFNAYKWAKSGSTEYERIINLKTLDNEYSGIGHWSKAYYFQAFTWHYQTKLLFRKVFETASIDMLFLIHETESEITSLSDIEEFLRKHYDNHVKDRDNKFVPTTYETIEIDGIQWLKYSGNLMPHLANRIKDNFSVQLDRNHFLMISIESRMESRSDYFPKIEDQVHKDIAALIAGVRFDPGKN